jgi:hypothetical protein
MINGQLVDLSQLVIKFKFFHHFVVSCLWAHLIYFNV